MKRSDIEALAAAAAFGIMMLYAILGVFRFI